MYVDDKNSTIRILMEWVEGFSCLIGLFAFVCFFVLFIWLVWLVGLVCFL